MFIYTENNQVVSMSEYEVSIPDTVTKHTISAEDYQKILKGTHVFDPITKSIVARAIDESVLAKKFLASTDWMVLRHIRQRALGEKTSLTEEEYLQLEQKRSVAASKV